MSVAAVIDQARESDLYEGNVLVIFPGSSRGPRLTLQWDEASERWLGECSDGINSFHYLAPCSIQGSDDVVAVAGALDLYLDHANGGFGGNRRRDRLDRMNAEISRV